VSGKNLILPDKLSDKDYSPVLKDVSENVSDIGRDMEELIRGQKDILAQINDLKHSVGEVGKFVNEKEEVLNSEGVNDIIKQSHTEWSEIVKKNLKDQSKVTIDHVKQALTEISENDKEKELRSRGIVIYNAEERNTSAALQKNADTKLIEDLLGTLGCENSAISEMFRMGRFDESRVAMGRFRPIKLRLSLNSDRDRVLKCLFKLKNANPELAKLSIREDLSVEQRNELNEKLKEAKRLTENSQDKIYRVRGTPGKYRFVEQPKKSVAV